MYTYQYQQIVANTPSEFISLLNQYGSDGWEVVSIITPDSFTRVAYLKKAVKQKRIQLPKAKK